MKTLALLRELFGWILLGIGLAAFGLAGFLVFGSRMACSASVVTVIGFVIFRGGIHIIKVAVAARAAAEVRSDASGTRTVRRPTVHLPSPAQPRPTAMPGPNGLTAKRG